MCNTLKIKYKFMNTIKVLRGTQKGDYNDTLLYTGYFPVSALLILF